MAYPRTHLSQEGRSMLRWVGTHRKLTVCQLIEELPIGVFFYQANDCHCRVNLVVEYNTTSLWAVQLEFNEAVYGPIEVHDQILEVPIHQWRCLSTFADQVRELSVEYTLLNSILGRLGMSDSKKSTPRQVLDLPDDKREILAKLSVVIMEIADAHSETTLLIHPSRLEKSHEELAALFAELQIFLWTLRRTYDLSMVTEGLQVTKRRVDPSPQLRRAGNTAN